MIRTMKQDQSGRGKRRARRSERGNFKGFCQECLSEQVLPEQRPEESHGGNGGYCKLISEFIYEPSPKKQADN